MNNGISVVVCSRETNEQKNGFIQHIKETCGCNAHVYFLINQDGVGLTQIYKDMLQNDSIDNDIIVFIHDDIEFLKNGWGSEVLRLFNKYKDYGIIGVAGSDQFDKQGAWWQYENKYGQVLHRHDGKSLLSAFSPLLKTDLQEVCVVDGLFIAVHKKGLPRTLTQISRDLIFTTLIFAWQTTLTEKRKSVSLPTFELLTILLVKLKTNGIKIGIL